MASNTRNVRISFPLVTLGFITWLVLLILKVTGVAAISWFWVWFPFWLPWAIIGAICVIMFILVGIVATIDD